jgi:glycolate oxidase
MFNDEDIQQQLNIKQAFDNKSLLNPGKVYPILHRCAEGGKMHVHKGDTKFKDIPRF